MIVNTTYFEFIASEISKKDKHFHYFWSVPSVERSKTSIKPMENHCFGMGKLLVGFSAGIILGIAARKHGLKRNVRV